jgi:uncharacterized protein YciI
VITVPYFLVLLEPLGDAAAADEHFADHVTFVDQMIAENVVLLGGAFDGRLDGAMAAYLLRTPSRAIAEEWAARDPLMARGACRARVVRWDLVGINPHAIDPRL